MERSEKIAFLKSLMWDYNISAEQCLEVLEGKRERAGHYNAEILFKKMIESWRWFTILKFLPIDRIYELLSDDLLENLRDKKLVKHYRFLKNELQRELKIELVNDTGSRWRDTTFLNLSRSLKQSSMTLHLPGIMLLA